MGEQAVLAEAGPVLMAYREPRCAGPIALVAESFERLLGKPLVAIGGDPVEALWQAPFAVVAHGTEPDPLFFFGNAAALAAFECDAAQFVGMPSRLSAEAPLREERQRLLDRVTTQGFIDDYAGVRISAKGRRFRIGPAVVWNLMDGAGLCHGQAATFAP
ncbi:MEKHLA domain-containing protein [Novosphingobium sp. PhB165]|uniref:MEKHLA domain-containing protein n=1 Tax=Novosphingobium sp. PhB165 TaxID=2485105 RepID=UPI0010EA19F1|nr:MEKHLA domain-containing protein [Novosphingobium sp. PhB165]TCM22003.1 MEKHLA domain-containing protein [Novosphingobium sp. PhB165]